jgi:hypothetical protein
MRRDAGAIRIANGDGVVNDRARPLKAYCVLRLLTSARKLSSIFAASSGTARP